MVKNKLIWFIEKHGNKYRKVGNCFRLPYVKDYVSVELGFIKIVTVTFPAVKYVLYRKIVKFAILGNRYK